jgi:hypothetical protein
MAEKQIKINRFDTVGVNRTSTFKYIENTNLGDDVTAIKQTADVVGANSTRTILKTINVGIDIYGLGQSTAGNNFALYKSSDYGATFTELNPGDTGTFAQIENPFFVYYQGVIYFFNSLYIGKYTISGGAFDGNWETLSIGGNAFNGGVEWQGKLWGWHGNDLYYIPTGGTKVQMNAIPSDQSIVDLVPYGNLLAVICSSATGSANMYLVDGVATTTFVDIIPIGSGKVAGGSMVDGIIKVVIATGFGGGTGFEIRYYATGGFKPQFSYKGVKNTTGDNFTYLISRVKTYGNFIYFLIGATRPGTTTTANSFSVQLVRFGSKLSGQQSSFSVYKDLNFVPSSITRATDRYNDFVLLDLQSGYYSLFANCLDNGSTPTFKEIRTTTTFAQAAVIETGVMTGSDSSIEKQLNEMSIMCSPLTIGQSIKLYYKPDADTTWTEIQTIDTVGTITYEPVLQADGNNLRTSKEVQFQFQLLGGAELTGFYAKYEEEII